jgi:hypothetical protein
MTSTPDSELLAEIILLESIPTRKAKPWWEKKVKIGTALLLPSLGR